MSGLRTGSIAIVLFSLAIADANEPSPRLYLTETAQAITIRQGPQHILTYRKQAPELPHGMDPAYRRSGFLHPVATPRGGVVTAAYPADHAHQTGIFSAWVKTTYDQRPIDFWNLAKQEGRVTHDRVVTTFCTAHTAGFEVELLHQVLGDPPVDVLRDRWRVTCYATAHGYHMFDLESQQTALTDKPLTVEKYHYGGMALRGPTAWIRSAVDGAALASTFLNNLGSDHRSGNHERAQWVALAGEQAGQPIYIAVLSHQDNFRAPQPARLHPTKPYFCFTPCVEKAFVIDQAHPLQSRYRYIVSDSKPDPDWLHQQWQSW